MKATHLKEKTKLENDVKDSKRKTTTAETKAKEQSKTITDMQKKNDTCQSAKK